MTEKKKVGRPATYKTEYEEQARKMSLLGLTDVQMVDVFGVSVATWTLWKKKHPELLASMKKGKDAADADVSASLYERACGYSHPDTDIRVIRDEIVKTEITKHYPPDTAAAFIWLKNRQPALWRDKKQTELEKLQCEKLKKELNDGGHDRSITVTYKQIDV